MNMQNSGTATTYSHMPGCCGWEAFISVRIGVAVEMSRLERQYFGASKRIRQDLANLKI